jgi:hypothetical protein
MKDEDQASLLQLVSYPLIPAEAFEVAREDTTCFHCEINKDCKFAWDPYNTDGDCLADK